MDPLAEVRPPILVINDNVEEAEQLCRLFDALGADTLLAFGAVSAAQMLQAARPAVVLLVELRLGGDDSRSVLEWLRRQGDDTARPFYICAGHGLGARQRTGDDDFDLYLELPVEKDFARDLVRIARHKHQQMQQATPAPEGQQPPARRR